jgi:N-acetylmuramoyl-L-alanine amidase
LAKIRLRLPRSRFTFALALVAGLGLLLWPTRPGRSDDFVCYLPNAHQAIPLEVVNNTKYIPLLRLLNFVGKVSGFQEKRSSLQVWFGKTRLELRADNKVLHVNREVATLSQPVRVSNGQWMVPVDFLTSVLPELTRNPVTYQAGTNRVFIGEIQPNTFTVRLDQLTSGARLTVQFTDKVTVHTAAQNGAWVMFLGERPVQPLEQSYQFRDPFVRELRFDDHDGVPKLILTPAENGLDFYPALAEGGKVLLADVLKPPPVTAERARPAGPGGQTAPTAETSSGAASAEEAPATQPGPPLPVVVLDAGHGGPDTGARSRDGMTEKDLAAQLVARARLALLNTKKFRILLTRVGDINPTFEQREVAANIARPAVFLSFHASDLGSGGPRIAIYTYQPPSSPAAPQPAGMRGLLVPWTRVQLKHLERSHALAEKLQQHFGRIQGVMTEPPASVPVRALRSVDAPAVAIEVGSLSPDRDATALTDPGFLLQLSTEIAQAVEEFQTR